MSAEKPPQNPSPPPPLPEAERGENRVGSPSPLRGGGGGEGLHPPAKPGGADERFEQVLGNLLRVGVMLAAGGGGLHSDLDIIALLAFPAIILGGLDSPGGAIVGGVIIGITQNVTAGYQGTGANHYFGFLGGGFSSVMPYVVMIVILMVRPYGLFGTREVRRI